MTVLILDEYRRFSEEELKKILREEAHNIKIESEKVIDPELYEDYLEYNVDDLEILKGI